MIKKIKKAVFPVAGIGSRFLPATKVQPKEMLPIVDKPLIQYAVEEALAAGVTEMIFITSRNKRMIEDHFDTAYELEHELATAGKTSLLESVQKIIPKNIHCVYIRQMLPLGLGHAVLCAEPVIGNDPFAVILADDLMINQVNQAGVLTQMLEQFDVLDSSLLAVEEVPLQQTQQYGILRATAFSDTIERVEQIVEKPNPSDAPSNLAVVGRYVLTPRIFDCLRKIPKGYGGEIQLTDAISMLLAHEPVFAYRYHGKRYDCGSKIGYLKATLDLGLRHPEVGQAFTQYVKEQFQEKTTS